MADLVGPIDAAVGAVTRLRSTLHKGKNRHVRSSDELVLIKATAQTWFKNHRPALTTLQNDAAFKVADQAFVSLLEWADQNTTRAKYRVLLQTTKTQLVKLRSRGVLAAPSVDPPRPQFGSVISDPKMLSILDRRWNETLSCQPVGADAHYDKRTIEPAEASAGRRAELRLSDRIGPVIAVVASAMSTIIAKICGVRMPRS